jgi:hypothetical protein
MKSILTKYLGPTNVRGSRIKASDGDNAVIIGYRDELRSEDAHAEAAKALCNKLNWHGELCRGGLRKSRMDIGYVFVWINDDDRFTV